MAWIDDFIKCKKERKRLAMSCRSLKEILDETYGIILYQEQVMMIANKIANFHHGPGRHPSGGPWGKEDRRDDGTGKEGFRQRRSQNGIAEKRQAKIFEKMEPFAQYGFNKSHLVAYASIAVPDSIS